MFYLVMLVIQLELITHSRTELWLIIPILPFLCSSLLLQLPLPDQLCRQLSFYRFMVIILGPFASIGCIIQLIFTPRQHLASEYREFVAAEAVFTPSERFELGLAQDYWQGGDSTITPYVDIMEGDDSPLKRATINKVIQHPGPSSHLILHTGLNDKDPDVRFYAASALIILNDTFINEFREIQRKISEEPENPLHHLNLATAYDRYCSWDLPGEEDMENYREKMVSSYRQAWALDSNNINAMIGLTKALISRSDYEEAENILERGLKKYPNSLNLVLQQLILLFNRKEIKKLRQLAKEYLKRFPNSALEIQEAVAFWGDSRQNGIYYEHYVP